MLVYGLLLCVVRRIVRPVVRGTAVKWTSTNAVDWVAAAIANVAIGIDIEQRPRQLDASIESVLLNHGEAAGSLGNDALLQRWVAKEAWIKAQGESALPARLKQLQLHPATAEFANVSLHSNEAFHFALAIAPAIAVTWREKQKMISEETYCVSE